MQGMNKPKRQVWKKNFKSKKETREMDSFKKAKILRNYAKLCAAEGIQSDRVHIGPRDETKKREKKNKKPKKSNPFERAEVDAKNSKQAAEEERERKQRVALEIENAKRIKKEKKKLVTARTKGGQPILANQISLMMQKLQGRSN